MPHAVDQPPPVSIAEFGGGGAAVRRERVEITVAELYDGVEVGT